MSDFFANYAPYLPLLLSDLHSQTVDEGVAFLDAARRFSKQAFESSSKGTPFYWMGIAAFRCHDFQTATLLFDAAVSEDLRFAPHNNSTPAILTMQLEDKNIHQAALPIVKTVVSRIESTINKYNARSGSSAVTMDHIR